MHLFFITATAITKSGSSWWNARWIALRTQARRPWNLLFRVAITVLVLTTVAIVGGVAWVLISGSFSTIRDFGLSFLTYDAFDPIHDKYGVSPAIFGTLVSSAVAIVFAVPIGVGTAIFLTDFCPRPLRAPLGFLVDSLAAIPSIIMGLWGFLVLVPFLQNTGEPWLQQHLGFLPFFQGQPHGVGLLAAGLILTVMILPIITAIAREVMLVVPNSQREALLALGATRWEVIRYAVIPFARVGIVGGAILGLGRALGETVAVTLVIGNQASPPSASLFNTAYSLASVILNQFGEATPGHFLSAIMETGLLLLIITVITTILARLLVARFGHVGGLSV